MSLFQAQRFILLFILLSINVLHVSAQDFETFYDQSLENNKNGMIVLGSWAVGNLVAGGIGWSQTSGKTKYFHQMNFFWNTVNLGLASFGYFNAINTDIQSLTGTEMLAKHKRFETVLLVNAGLDIGYMGLGYYLNRRSTNADKNKDLLGGYGNSLMLQGAFLFLFDLALYAVQRNHRISSLHDSALNLSFTGNQLAILYQF
jgi:hypothetical protein